MSPLEEAVRKNARSTLGLQSPQSCKTCPSPVWFAAFFDGTGNNYPNDGNGDSDASNVKYSNVAKLAWFAHAKAETLPRTKFEYIEGVGTPCNKEGVNDSGQGADKAGGMAAATKGEARIHWMLRQLKRHVDTHMPLVNQINLAVFGFSRGAAQARAFARMLGEELATWDGQQLLWKQAGAAGRPRVVIYFMGIFDTVASVGYGGSRAESAAKAATPLLGPVLGPAANAGLNAADQGGHAAWAHDLAIPAYVERCVHYVAGHEVREKFPSDSVRKNRNVPGNCVEVVYPGVHSDVGGGYAPAADDYQEGRVNELARIPLCHMYIEAYKAGVPLDPPARVVGRAGQLFEISDELAKVFNAYMSPAPTRENSRLENAVIWHMNRYYEWRESRRQRMKSGQLKPVKPDQYMVTTDAEWEEDALDVASGQTGASRKKIGPHHAAIFEAFGGKRISTLKPLDRAIFDLMFDKYVHDSIAGFKLQMSEAKLGISEMSRWSVNRRYFVGKSGKRHLYWRYESSGSSVAGIRFVDDDKPHHDGIDDPLPVDQDELEAQAREKRARLLAAENARHADTKKKITDDTRAILTRPQKLPGSTGSGPWRMDKAAEDEYLYAARLRMSAEDDRHAREIRRIEQETAVPAP